MLYYIATILFEASIYSLWVYLLARRETYYTFPLAPKYFAIASILASVVRTYFDSRIIAMIVTAIIVGVVGRYFLRMRILQVCGLAPLSAVSYFIWYKIWAYYLF